MLARVLAGVVLLGLLACAPAVTPAATPREASVAAGVVVLREQGGRVLINSALGVAAYPGSRVLAQRYSNRASSTEFEVRDDLFTVYSFFHRSLVDRGWARATFTLRGETRIEARYTGPGDDLGLNLERLRGSRYRLELE
jgi:hypothetical protein